MIALKQSSRRIRKLSDGLDTTSGSSAGLLACFILSLSTILGWAQGTINFANNVMGSLRAPVYGPEPCNPSQPVAGNTSSGIPAGNTDYRGSILLSGTNYTAELWVGTSATNLLAVAGSQTSFQSGSGAGYIVPRTLSVPGVPAGNRIQYQMRVWDNRAGKIRTWQQAVADSCLWRGSSELLLSNPLGSGTNTGVNLTELRSFGIHSECLPLIVTPPATTAASLGGSATFSVTAQNPPAINSSPLTYQWQADAANIPGATNSSYTRLNVQPTHGLPYRVIVQNGFGAVTSRVARLDVNGVPSAAVPVRSAWRFLDTRADPGAAWAQLGFDDSRWAVGQGVLGFGENNLTTTLQAGALTYYFRRSFHVPNVSQVGAIRTALLRDDGGIVYINGTEVFRSNMPPGPVSDLTPALTTTSGSDETNYFNQLLGAPLVNGVNVIAVEIHQDVTNSQDLSFDLELRVNTFPTISSIADLTVAEDQSTELIPFAIGDAETAATNLTLVAVSSNESLVPSGNIIFDGIGNAKRVRVTPTPDQSGTTLITINVNDGEGAGATESFLLTVIGVDDPPTLGVIQDITLNKNAPTRTVPLSEISSGPSESQALTLTATSSAPGIVPNPVVSYTSPAATGTLSITPVSNASGSATITVIVRDAGLDGVLNNQDDGTFSRQFTVKVNAVNDPPTLAAIGELTLDEDAPAQVVNLTGISSGSGESQALTLTATSSAPGIVPNPVVSYTSPATNGTLTLTPVPNVSGSATITVTVRDAGLDGVLNNQDDGAFSRQFSVKVNAVNDPPTLATIGDLTLDEDAPAQVINLAGISSGSGESQALTLTATSSAPGIVPNPVVSYTSPAANGTLTLAPVPNASGSATITVTVRDAGLDGVLNNQDDGTVFRQFTVKVNKITAPPQITNFQKSTPAAFGSMVRLTPTITGDPPLIFEWRFNGELIPNATNASYTVPSFQCEHEGEYEITVCHSVECRSGSTTVTSTDVYDFGDAPNYYGVLRSVNGARHRVLAEGFRLGERIDGEATGHPSADALGDDQSGTPETDDEDGVDIPSVLEAGTDDNILIRIRNTGKATKAHLNAWIDYNGNGVWESGNETIAQGLPIGSGDLTLPIHIPVETTNGTTFARFRLSETAQFLSPLGCADDGEVEDYSVELVRSDLVLEPCESTHRGTRFWVAFPGNYDTDPADPLRLSLCILGAPETRVGIAVPGEARTRVLRIDAAGKLDVPLPSSIQLESSDLIETKGISIEADREVTVIGHSINSFTSDTFLALPAAIAGREYMIMGYPNTQVGVPELAGTQLAIVAGEPNTRVTIIPTVRVPGRDPGEPYEIRLQRGQTYFLRGQDDAPDDITGTVIIASKPISAFGGHRCANVNLQDSFFCNYLVEQLLPTRFAGTNFCLVPSLFREKGDTFRILALNDQTHIRLAGIPEFLLDRGQVFETNLLDYAFLRTSLPVLAAQFGNSADLDRLSPGDPPLGDSGDPTMTIVPSTDMFLSDPQTVCTAPGAFTQHVVTLITRTDERTTITSNGLPVASSIFFPVGTGPYSAGQVQVAPGTHQFACSAPLLVLVRGHSQFEAYSHLGGLFFPDRTPPTLFCPAAIRITNTQPSQCEVTLPDLFLGLSVVDNCERSGEFLEHKVQSPPPGTPLRPGTYPARLTAADLVGNSITCTTMVSVIDPRPAAVQVPKRMDLTCNDGLEVITPAYPVSALHPCDTSVRLICEPPPGSRLGIGQYTVQCIAETSSGIRSTNDFILAVSCPKLSVSLVGNGVILDWSGDNGILERAPSFLGPWLPVSVTSSHYSVPISSQTPSEYFRVRYPGP